MGATGTIPKSFRKYLTNIPGEHDIKGTTNNNHIVHCTALHCTALYSTALHCTALHCTPLHCTALHCTALHCTALYCTHTLESTDVRVQNVYCGK